MDASGFPCRQINGIAQEDMRISGSTPALGAGDLMVTVRDGYHPVVAWLQRLLPELSRRQRAAAFGHEDAYQARMRSTWNQVDLRVPLVRASDRLRGTGE